MRHPLAVLFLALLAACTTRVPEPDATTQEAPDWEDAAVLESLASDAEMVHHRMGSNYNNTIPPSSIQPSSNSGYVLTTVTGGSAPSWQAASGGGVTWANDLAGSTSTSQKVVAAQSGVLSFGTLGQIQCANNVGGCGLSVLARTTDAATNGVQLLAQSAYPSATTNVNGGVVTIAGGSSAGGAVTATGGGVVLQGGTSAATTSGTGGSVTALLQAPVGTGSEAAFYVDRGSSTGTHVFAVGQTSSAIPSLWLGLGATAPTATNAVFRSNGGYTQLNGSNGISLLINGSYEGLLQSGLAEFGSTATGSAYGGSNVLVLDNGSSPTSSPTAGAVLASVSGALTVTPTGTTTPALSVGSLSTSVNNTLLTGYLSYTPANGSNTLTSAQAAVGNLYLAAGATAAVTITDPLTLSQAKGAQLVIRNTTSQTVTFGWSTGTGCTIATATSAVVTSDGTQCVVMVHGT